MTAPSTPFCTQAQVSYLLQNTFFKGRPNSASVPDNIVTPQLISWTDAVVQAAFSRAGYEIPFEELTGTTWPEHQTVMLSYISAVGSAAQISGYVLTPVPSRRSQASGEGNVFGVLFNTLLDTVEKDGLGFVAAYKLGTVAEKVNSDPYGPRLDFLEDYIDPTRYQLLEEYTNMIMGKYDYVELLDLDWDYLYELRSSSAD